MSYPFELETREEMVQAAQLMHVRGLISGHDGNISVRVGPDRILCTPSAMNKGFLKERDLVVVDLEGKLQRGKVPPHCVACTLVGISLETAVVPEAAFLMGAVPTAPYATPGTDEVPKSIEPFIGRSEAILLARHGSITFGRTVMEAYNRLEALEHVAQVLFLANNLGQVVPLTDDELGRLHHSVTSRGIPWRYPTEGAAGEQLVDTIVQKVVEKLRKG